MKNFRSIVNEAGLPIEMGFAQGRVSNAKLGNLSAEELAELYWLTKTIFVEYRYEINGRVIDRRFEMDGSEHEPSYRALMAPNFMCQHFDQKFKTSTSIHIPIHLACKSFDAPDRFDVPITISESAPNGIFSFEIYSGNENLIDRFDANFLKKPISFGIYSKNPKLPGRIEYVDLRCAFFS